MSKGLLDQIQNAISNTSMYQGMDASTIASLIEELKRAPPSFRFIKKHHRKLRIVYTYINKGLPKEIWILKSKFSKEEIDFIDSLFSNLDESNLVMIRSIINSRMRKDD